MGKKINFNKIEKPSYAPKILKKDFIINWQDNSLNIHNKIRALSYKGAYGMYKNKRVKFFNTHPAKSNKKMQAGSFYYKENKIYIKTGNAYLAASKIQLEGARVINVKDFYNTLKEGPYRFE